jgi:hypothetical protein
MLCGETVAVGCENSTEHTDTLKAVRTSQVTRHVSATEPNRLMLCGETVAVCCENRMEHTDTLWAVRTSQYEGYTGLCNGMIWSIVVNWKEIGFSLIDVRCRRLSIRSEEELRPSFEPSASRQRMCSLTVPPTLSVEDNIKRDSNYV